MAIDDNTSYELTGYQVKDLAQKIRAKADSSSLAPVATSGLYSDLTGKPTIPTVYNGTLTIQQDGAALGTFSANQNTNTTINIPSGGMHKESVYLFCGNINYALYGGDNSMYAGHIGRFYTAIGDPLNTQEIPFADVLDMIDNPDTDLEIIGFVRNDSASTSPLHTLFHQITDDKYSYQYDYDRNYISVVITGVDVTETAPTSFREQLTLDYSDFPTDNHATVVGRKALTPLVVYFANTLPTTDPNTHLPFLSVADLKNGTSIVSELNTEYISRYMAACVNAIEGCELEWRVYDTTGDKVVKVYRADVIEAQNSSTGYYLYDYDDTDAEPRVHRYTLNMQYIVLADTWAPSGGGGGSGPEVITWLTNADLTTASAGQPARLYGPSTPPTTVDGFVAVMDKFLNNGAIITLSDTTNFSVWFFGTTACRITRVGVNTVNGSSVLNFYFDGPGTVKRIQVATNYGSDPVTVTLEA